MKLSNYMSRLLFIIMLSYLPLIHATESGLFWRLQSPNGKVSYLFGTMHSDDNRITNFSSALYDAIEEVDAFVMETKPSQDTAHYFMQGDSLVAHLTDDELDSVRALADFHVMHYEQALKMKPWLLSIVFSQSKPHTPFAQDNLLMRAAEDRAKAILELETAEEHFTVIDDFTLDEQLTMLRAALNLTEEKKDRDFEQLLATYLSGDGEAILALDEALTGSQIPKPLWKKMQQRILVDRNMLMGKNAVAYADKQSVFIAVGAAHLAGENGLIAAFKKAGYTLSLAPNWIE